KKQPGFRQRFQRNFRHVCDALAPRTVTIFVDDIDRCEPAKAAEMLEAINYLVNSGGRCFVVLGMAREVVEAQLALHYRDLAGEYERMSGTAADADAGARYARKYLRKLVNLEVRLPEPSAPDIDRLLDVKRTEREEEAPALRSARRVDEF